MRRIDGMAQTFLLGQFFHIFGALPILADRLPGFVMCGEGVGEVDRAILPDRADDGDIRAIRGPIHLLDLSPSRSGLTSNSGSGAGTMLRGPVVS